MNERPIGVFESGQGGLTAVKELIQLLPSENIVYFGDTARVPYGAKSRDAVIKYAKQDIAFLKSLDVKMIIAACGTVSAILPNEDAENIGLPYSGVLLPAAKRAAELTKTGRICVLGTQATVKSGAYKEAITSIKPNLSVLSIACPLFVPLVENGYTDPNSKIARLAAEEYLKDVIEFAPDVIILGCTHFPLLAPLISSILPSGIELINPGLETAHYAKELLEKHDIKNSSDKAGKYRFFVSDDAEGFVKNASLFLGREISGETEKTTVDFL